MKIEKHGEAENVGKKEFPTTLLMMIAPLVAIINIKFKLDMKYELNLISN